jgi:hypothetical protein
MSGWFGWRGVGAAVSQLARVTRLPAVLAAGFALVLATSHAAELQAAALVDLSLEQLGPFT